MKLKLLFTVMVTAVLLTGISGAQKFTPSSSLPCNLLVRVDSSKKGSVTTDSCSNTSPSQDYACKNMPSESLAACIKGSYSKYARGLPFHYYQKRLGGNGDISGLALAVDFTIYFCVVGGVLVGARKFYRRFIKRPDK